MKLFGLAGWSGSGKTTLLVALLPALIGRGLRVSTIKHVHHKIDLDEPGKDTHRHRLAGATDVVLLSPSRWVLMHENRDRPEASPAELLARMTPVDLVLIEGLKRARHDKLEVHRPALGKPLLCRDDPHVVAVASDGPVPEIPVPLLRLDDTEAIAAFIVRHCGL